MSHASRIHDALNDEPSPVSAARGRAVSELLGEFRAKLAATPDEMSKAPCACPHCGAAISVTVGRHSKRYFFRHPSGHCHSAGDINSYTAASREQAIEQWTDEVTP